MKRTKKLEFSAEEREKIRIRDGNRCIFCEMRYHMKSTTEMGYMLDGIMHYIPRSKGGLGIEENGAIGCHYHHQLMDNGSKGLRTEMLTLMREYLQEFYPGWNEKNLIFNKWRQNNDDK